MKMLVINNFLGRDVEKPTIFGFIDGNTTYNCINTFYKHWFGTFSWMRQTKVSDYLRRGDREPDFQFNLMGSGLDRCIKGEEICLIMLMLIEAEGLRNGSSLV